jgi:DNA-binding transcriptional MerR regulator
MKKSVMFRDKLVRKLGISEDMLDELEKRKIVKPFGITEENVPYYRDEVTSGKHLTIGDLAAKVEVSARTLKHWEEKGIIEADMRSSGGFRLYSEIYVYLCKLVKDLQLFGYSLGQIKDISDHFRDFLVINKNIDVYSYEEIGKKLDSMSDEIKLLKERILLLKEGIGRWEELINKKVKEISALKKRNRKRLEKSKKPIPEKAKRKK